MCVQPFRNITDITVEFYHKTAVYKSKITGAEVPINIKKVERYEYKSPGRDFTLVTSDRGVTYHLELLTLPV